MCVTLWSNEAKAQDLRAQTLSRPQVRAGPVLVLGADLVYGGVNVVVVVGVVVGVGVGVDVIRLVDWSCFCDTCVCVGLGWYQRP